ncbi:hypothetical protein MFLAVUS_006000 [Mucor flavus]|uniref:Uncharacterized protein n=1 Tax=Mucor flavus TaxID=439312 RepID=A0ABP9Z096_9FUNG
MDNFTQAETERPHPGSIPKETAFSIMFVSVGMSCFIYQAITSGNMFYKARKPIIGIVFAQAALGIIVTFVTLLTSIVEVDCTFRLLFSVVGVNVGDMSLQFVLLWKAYLGNNRSKLILILGSIPILAIAVFIWVNMTIGKSKTFVGVGLCATEYLIFAHNIFFSISAIYIVVSKAAIDCTANTFLSGCFILTLSFGVCFSNILTGILLTKNVLGGSTPILYTIDWYLASYLIIQQLSHRTTSIKVDDDSVDDEDNLTVESGYIEKHLDDDEEEVGTRRNEENRDTYYSSMDGTLVPTSPRSPQFPSEGKYPVPELPPFEGKFIPSGIEPEGTQKYGISKYSSSITEVGAIDDDDKQKQMVYYNSSKLSKLSISQNSNGDVTNTNIHKSPDNNV